MVGFSNRSGLDPDGTSSPIVAVLRLDNGYLEHASRMRWHLNHLFYDAGSPMEYFQDKVAVITGAASGIGQALAERCLQEGMKVMLADVEADALTATAATFRARYNNPIETQVVDVSVLEALTALRDATLEAYGAVHLLFNNAGVGGCGWRLDGH